MWPHGSIHTASAHRNKLAKSAYMQPCSPSTEAAWPLFCPTDFFPPFEVNMGGRVFDMAAFICQSVTLSTVL